MAGVTEWRDRSGNSNHASQATPARQPVLAPNSFNGYPALLLDNDQTNPDFLVIPDNSTLEGMTGLTGFAVFDIQTGTPNSAPRGILSKRNGPSAQSAYAWFLWQSGSNLAQHLDIVTDNNRISGGSHGAGNVYVNGFVYHGGTPTNAQDQVLYMASTPVATGQENSTSIPNEPSDLYIGRLNGHTGTGTNATRFNGRIAEVILYNEAFNEVQRTIVNNYLAAKYGLSLSSKDLYTMDDPANGNHDHEVAGIGRESGFAQNVSRGTGIVEIKPTSGTITDNTYLFWGHNNGIFGAWGVGDVPAGVDGRLERVWRVSEVTRLGAPADVGAVDITFDLNGMGNVDATHLRLIVDVNNDGVFANDTLIAGATDLGGGLYRFTSVVAITNARRFTLATTDLSVTPLPVELLSFSAKATADGRILLDWSTASEQNSASFAVERSSDAELWSTVLTGPAAGQSNTLIQYAAEDLAPLPGTSYYRLRQVDLDGSVALSSVVAVTHTENRLLQIYPVPFSAHLWIHAPAGELLGVELYDAMGRQLGMNALQHGDRWLMDTAHLPEGPYFLRTRTAAGVDNRAVLKAD